jgi:hypothetical protein
MILADYHMVKACNPSVLVAQWDCSCLPSEPKAQPGLGSDVPPDQLAFPSCDGKGKVRNVRLLLFINYTVPRRGPFFFSNGLPKARLLVQGCLLRGGTGHA